MYASKLLIYQRPVDDSTASLPQSHNPQRKIRTVSELNNEEIKCAARLYELICHLVLIKQQFLTQFCDAVPILAADELIINFFNQDFKTICVIYNSYKWFESLENLQAFTKKKEKDRAASRANTQPFTEYISFHMRIIFILCCVYMLSCRESKSTTNLFLSMNMMSTWDFEYE